MAFTTETMRSRRDTEALCIATVGLVLVVAGCSRPSAPISTAIASFSPQPFTRPVGVLRVCADPNNLPFSNEKQEGFENRIADLLAHDLGDRVEYTWRAGACDVVIGVPAGFEMALTTAPYYRSTYVFVSRKDRHLEISSLDDPR